MVTTRYLIRIKYSLTILLAIFLLLAGNESFAVNITVKVSHNPIALDDSFHLIYEADSNVDDDPDFSPIEQNFDILNSSQSTNMRLINGSYSLKKSWDLVLMARDVGSFTIPSISFGQDKSPSIRLKITNSVTPNSTLPNGTASIPAKIFLESSVDKKTAWVQEQIILSIRLLRTVGITGASLSEPKTSDPDAIIQRLGEDSSYQTTRNGIRYDVIERRYVIFPQHSGQLTIKPVTFEGRVNSTQPRTIFDQFRMSGQLKRLHSPSVKTRIKPTPASINKQDWLPASNLTLVDDWSEDISKARTGDPITRTITIVAEGQAGDLLPDLAFDDIDGLKLYPDKAVSTDQTKPTGITGAKQVKVAIIPARPGDYILPEVKLSWWNTRTNKPETATLPETRLHVSGAAVQAPKPAVPTPIPTNESMAVSPGAESALANSPVSETARFWQWISLVLATGWGLTLLYLFFHRGNAHPASRQKKQAVSIAPLEKAVLQACKQKQPDAIKNALLAWAQARWPEQHINSLSQLAEQCPPALGEEIEQLNRTLYDPDADKSSLPAKRSKALEQAFRQYKRVNHSASKSTMEALEPLYKV